MTQNYTEFKYLRSVVPSCDVLYLTHNVLPTVRAMFASFMSRVPAGGIQAKYREVLEKIANNLTLEDALNIAKEDEHCVWYRGDVYHIAQLGGHGKGYAYLHTGDVSNSGFLRAPLSELYISTELAEEKLTQHPLPAVVVDFIEKYIGEYGHSSPIELTGDPCVFVENVSPETCYWLFDSALVQGQETSTRAVTRKDWPMCREAAENADLQGLHNRWLRLYVEEVAAWKLEFRTNPAAYPDVMIFCEDCEDNRMSSAGPCGNRGCFDGYRFKDTDGFRPAFDRSRWALPGTIATGMSMCSHLRDRARALKTLEAIATRYGSTELLRVVEDIRATYRASMPYLSKYGLRESVYEDEKQSALPHHIEKAFTNHKYTGKVIESEERPETSLMVHNSDLTYWSDVIGSPVKVDTFIDDLPGRDKNRTYLDPSYNVIRVDLEIHCSWAVARDWHRHRTAYPWVRLFDRLDCRASCEHPALFLTICNQYTPMSDYGDDKLPALLLDTASTIYELKASGHEYEAALAHPLGAAVTMGANMGLRDAVYMLELRYFTKGANFEYKKQAIEMLFCLVNLSGIREIRELADRLKIDLDGFNYR